MFSYGDHKGSVTSSQGDAVLVAVGNSARPKVSAGKRTSVLVAGDATGVDISASDWASVRAEGDLQGQLTAVCVAK